MQYHEVNTLKHNFKENPFNAKPDLLNGIESITNILYEPNKNELKTLWIKIKNPDYATFRKDLLKEYPDTDEEDIRYEYEKYSEPYSFYQIKEINLKDGRSFVFIDNDLIASHNPTTDEAKVTTESNCYRCSIKDYNRIMADLKDTVADHIAMLKAGTYKTEIIDRLPYYLKTGTIVRKDFYMALHKEKTVYDEFDDFKNKKEFLEGSNMFDPKENKSFRLTDMTARMFFNACLAGYIENGCAATGDDAKAMYYKYADGRDEGLSEVPLDNPEAFHKWLHERQYGGHPWEIMRGGNSTHVSLYVCEDEKGYFFSVNGRSESRFIETINCYLAIKRMGYPIVLSDSELLKDRLKGEEILGIVPQDVFPRYCDSMFPSGNVHNFMNIWEEDIPALPYVTWQEISMPKLK